MQSIRNLILVIIFCVSAIWVLIGLIALISFTIEPINAYKEEPVAVETVSRIEPVYVEPAYAFTDDDIYLLAQLLCGDKTRSGDGEYDIDYKKDINYYEVNKVLSVVMNRVRDDRFPDTIREVVLAHNQFVVMPRNLRTEPSLTALQVVQDWCDIYKFYPNTVQAVPDDHVYFSGNGVTNTTRR